MFLTRVLSLLTLAGERIPFLFSSIDTSAGFAYAHFKLTYPPTRGFIAVRPLLLGLVYALTVAL